MAGKVILVGAGPGDASLITIAGAEAIKNADVVVFDRLIGNGIIDLIPENVEKIDVGKNAGNHSVPQKDINKILVEKAEEGKNVVRLKGGDSYVFGRGGEEAEELVKNGISFSVVPGVTSAVAAPAYAGIPITHRDYSSSFHVITAHAKNGGFPDIDFKLLAKLGGTFIFLMGVSSINELMNNLLEAGIDKNTLAAVIERGTLPEQRQIVSTVEFIASKASDMKIKSPAVIVVGDVCSLSEKLNFIKKTPLYGKTIAVTRPKKRSKGIVNKLIKNGAKVIETPCIDIESTLTDDRLFSVIDKMNSSEWVVFTSISGVEVFFSALNKNGFDSRVFSNRKIAAIGSSTLAELKKNGINADLVPDVYDGEHLANMLVDIVDGKVLLLRAEKTGKDIDSIFESNNIQFENFPIYKTVFLKPENIDEVALAQYVTFTSSSTVEAFVSAYNMPIDTFTAVCIGKPTEREAKRFGMKTICASKADEDSILEAVISHSQNSNKPL